MMRIAPLMTLSVAVALLSGCGGQNAGSPQATPEKGTGSKVAMNPDQVKGAALKAAQEFLTKVKAGTATGADLTSDFKRHFAPPELSTDNAAGYSEAAATSTLKSLAGEVNSADVTIVGVAGETAYASANGGTAGTTLLRVTRAGNDWKIDWLAVAPQAVKLTGLGADAPAGFTAAALANAVLLRKFRLAEGLLSEAGKATLGKSSFGNNFDRGALKNKLEELFANTTSYTEGKSSKDEVELQTTAKRIKIKLDGDAKVIGAIVE